MKTKWIIPGKKSLFVIATALSLLCLGGIAHSNPISYSVGSWSQQFPNPDYPTIPLDAPWGPNGYPGDTVTLEGFTGTLELTQGVYTQKVGTLEWLVNYTYNGPVEPWPDVLFNFTANRSITFGVTQYNDALSQTGLLRGNYDYDYLSLNQGPNATFFAEGYKVEVASLALAEKKMDNWSGDAPWTQQSRDIIGTFTVTAVPEPGTIMFLGLTLVGLAGAGRKFIKK